MEPNQHETKRKTKNKMGDGTVNEVMKVKNWIEQKNVLVKTKTSNEMNL